MKSCLNEVLKVTVALGVRMWFFCFQYCDIHVLFSKSLKDYDIHLSKVYFETKEITQSSIQKNVGLEIVVDGNPI